MSKQVVHISLFSRQEDGGEANVTSQSHVGQFYRRESGHVLTYSEEGLTTTIVLAPGETRLYRRGSLESWQVFQPGKVTGGLLTLGVNPLPLRVVTETCEVRVNEEGGNLQLAYELFSDDGATAPAELEEISLGKFSLSLSWVVSEASEASR